MSPSANAANVAHTDDDSHGDGSGSFPISSATTTASSKPSPEPPLDSGTNSPVHPRSTTLDQNASVTPRSSSIIARTYVPGASAARNERATSRSASCSELNVKSTSASYFESNTSNPLPINEAMPRTATFAIGTFVKITTRERMSL